MRFEDVKVGMKVVPHSKSIYSKLNDCNSWKNAKLKSQPYLYVIKISLEEGYVVLNEDEKYTGDYFKPEDFELYEKKDFLSVKQTPKFQKRNIIIIEEKDLIL